jgi:hypothetical protein
MPYTIKLSSHQAEKIGVRYRRQQEFTCAGLHEFIFKAHQILQALHTAGYDTSNYMWFDEVPDTPEGEYCLNVGRLEYSHTDAAKRNPHPPTEKDSGWG